MALEIIRIGDEGMVENFDITDEEKSNIIRNFIDDTGKLTALPAQRKKKLILLEYMLRGLEHGKLYKEIEINEHIKQYYQDIATIRRELVLGQFMYHHNSMYEFNPIDMWPV